MSSDAWIRALVKEAVVEGIQDQASRDVIRSECRAAMSELVAAPAAGDEQEVDTQQAALLAHVQPRTINAWKRAGLLAPIKRGKSDVFRAGDVLAVAADRGSPRKILNMKAEAARILGRRPPKGGA